MVIDDCKAAEMVLGFVGGHPTLARPGDFFASLLEAMMRADFPNLRRLRNAFPELTDAVHLYRFDVAGYGILCDRAGVEPITDRVPEWTHIREVR